MRILFLLCLVFTVIPSSARDVDVVVGWNKPPYVISQEHSGFEVDLIRAILADMGHQSRLVLEQYLVSKRLLSLILVQQVCQRAQATL